MIVARARRLVSKLLGRQKKMDIEAHYVHEIDLFSYVHHPRPWVNCEDVSRIRLSKDDVDVLEYDLRRWEHAIDKGLQLPERRPGFGKDKILCILRMITLLREYPDRCRAVANTVGVMRRYIEALDSDLARTDLAEDKRAALTAWSKDLSSALSAFQDMQCPVITEPDHKQLSPTFFKRRSVRRWTDRPVDKDTLRLLVEAALWSPSSCNRQPHKFLFVEDNAKKAQLVATATGAVGFTEYAPVICVLLNDVRAYNSPGERHLAYIDTSLAAQNLTLAAHELGLGAVWLNWALPDVRAEQPVRKAMKIPPWYAIVALIALGYPDENCSCPPPIRRSVDETILFDTF